MTMGRAVWIVVRTNIKREAKAEEMLAAAGFATYAPHGKIERFWRTLGNDLIEGTTFDTLQHFADELFNYLTYYNAFRPHQALNGLTPKAFALTRQHQNQSANC